MSPEERTFTTDICTNPDDDTVRLVYADYLDEQGTEIQSARAKYIRDSIALHVLPSPPPILEASYCQVYVDTFEPTNKLSHRTQLYVKTENRRADIRVPIGSFDRNLVQIGSVWDVVYRTYPRQPIPNIHYYGAVVMSFGPPLNGQIPLTVAFLDQDPYEHRARRQELETSCKTLLARWESEWLSAEGWICIGVDWAKRVNNPWHKKFQPVWAPQWSRGFPYTMSVPHNALMGDFIPGGSEYAIFVPSAVDFPLTEVRLSERSPARVDDETFGGPDLTLGGMYFWRAWNPNTGFRTPNELMAYDVHFEVFELLKAKRGDHEVEHHLAFYPTYKEAVADLTAAATLFHRRRCGVARNV